MAGPRTHSSFQAILTAVVAASAMAIPTQAANADPPDTVTVQGVVRDFMRAHPDFDVTPVGGNGHFAGNIGLNASQHLPVFSGSGFKVAAQWRDQQARNIPPHLFSTGASLQLATAPVLDQGSYMDTWNHNDGPYGGGNLGPAPAIQTGAPMPAITPPSMAVPYQASVYLQDPSNIVTISADIYCGSLASKQQTTIKISGHRTIYCTSQFGGAGNFIPAKQNIIQILPNSSLRVYTNGQFKISQQTQMNMNTWDPTKCMIYNMGTQQVLLNQSCQLCATVVSPNAPLHLNQNDHFYGTFIGQSVLLDQQCGFHLDGMAQSLCGVPLADSAGAPGVPSTAGITSASTFAHWYNDVLGANLSTMHSIMLTRNGQGVYEYLDDSFFPIDGQLFGNEGDAHNHYFTFSFDVSFVFHACQGQGQFIEFQGADDAWVFIDEKLGIDLGGVMANTPQYVRVDRLGGLTDGNTYTLRLFYAQRNPNMAVFRFRTNLDLIPTTPSFSVSAAFD